MEDVAQMPFFPDWSFALTLAVTGRPGSPPTSTSAPVNRRVVATSHMNGADAEEVTKIDLSFPIGDDDDELDPALTAQVAEKIGVYLRDFFPEYERLDVGAPPESMLPILPVEGIAHQLIAARLHWC